MKEIHPALIIIDMINKFDFTHGPILAKKALQIAHPINKLKKSFNEKKLPVIFINDHYNLWQAEYTKIIELCRNQYSQPVYEKLLPGEEDYFLIKPKHSAFFGTGINTLLHQLKVNTLVLTGIAGNICVLFTANDAYMREFQLYAPENCIASADDLDNKYALTMMQKVLKANIHPTTDKNYIM
ncbi:isochorismatase family cysteine hydrolase [Bacillus xiapuensis]|uniref:Cysteine hydrolase n=1 Tax=Bacillus xiapuensis TaxID=2014075 RepID=A0ABU6N9C2_9BACI|nr:cysteine hydrolase [Bacillus xiapuensis]